MPTATFQKFECLSEHIAEQVHHFDTDVLKAMLSNQAPDLAAMTVKADVTEIAAGNGYIAGGVDIEASTSRTAGVTSLVGTDKVITASGGSIGPFRYVYIYNDTPTSPADPLVGVLDYGSAISIADLEDFTLDFGASFLDIGS